MGEDATSRRLRGYVMRSNPATYRGVAARKAASQAGAYHAVWQDLKRHMSRYKTVPLVADKAKQVYNTDIKPGIVYALKIGNALSQDAFTVFDDAVSVAQGLADRYDLPISVVDKKTKARVKTVGSRKKSAASYARNPVAEPSLGDYYFSTRGLTHSFKSKRAAMEAAQRAADLSGRRVTVSREDYGSQAGPYKAKPKPMRRNPVKRYYTLAVRDDGRWTPELGDYDRETVEYELDDYKYNGYKARDLKIITTGDKQADINAGISKLNA